ncbi:MAG: DUF4097 family beta strand repeat-containing protein [Pseudomonadales bacterium]
MKALTLTILSLCAATAMAREQIDRTLEANPNGTVSVSNTAGKVEVRGWSREEVHLSGKLSRGVEELIFERDGEEVVIVVKTSRKRRRGASADLEIRVPENSSVKVSAVSADIEVREVIGMQRLQTVSGDVVSEAAAADVEIKTVSGDIELQGNDKMGVFELTSVSGDVEMQNLAGEIAVNTVSGDSTLVDSEFSRARLQSTSGDIEFHAQLLESGRLNIETISGDLDVNFNDMISAKFDIESFNGVIDNCFGPEPVKTSKYTPGTSLKFSAGDGSGHVYIKSLNGDLDMCKD